MDFASLAKKGLSIFPIPWGQKRPSVSWKRYQEIPLSDSELKYAFSGGQKNIGIICGAISDVVVVDTDSDQAEKWAFRHLPETGMMTRTSKGFHRYYRYPSAEVRNKVNVIDGIDIRADGGYVIAPESKHPSGMIYESVGDWDISKIPMYKPDWFPQSIVKGQQRPTCVKSVGASSKIKRATAYINNVPGACQGSGGDHHTFVLASRLTRGFALDPDQCFQLMHQWNQACCPPWSERELRLKIQNALKYGREEIGGML